MRFWVRSERERAGDSGSSYNYSAKNILFPQKRSAVGYAKVV